jgi:hypothetical protein
MYFALSPTQLHNGVLYLLQERMRHLRGSLEGRNSSLTILKLSETVRFHGGWRTVARNARAIAAGGLES